MTWVKRFGLKGLGYGLKSNDLKFKVKCFINKILYSLVLDGIG